MQLHYHHYLKRKTTLKKQSNVQKKLNTVMDSVIYIFGTVGAVIFVPQLLTIWTAKSISGVSLYSWEGMLLGSTFWIMYGLVHKAKPVIYANILAASVQLLIIIGILSRT